MVLRCDREILLHICRPVFPDPSAGTLGQPPGAAEGSRDREESRGDSGVGGGIGRTGCHQPEQRDDKAEQRPGEAAG